MSDSQLSYSSPRSTKRFSKIGGKLDKVDSPKKGTKRKRGESLKLPMPPIRVRARSPTRTPSRTTVSVTIEKHSTLDSFSITAYLPQSGWKKLKLQAAPGMTVQQVVEAELPEVGQFAYQVYQFPSRALLNPERDATVLRDQEISIEPMQAAANELVEDSRLLIVKELLASEDNYLENLKSIFDTYAEPLKSWGVGPGDMKILFDSVGKLCDTLMNFFSRLEIAVQNWCLLTTRIGGLVKQFPHFWTLYEDYSSKYHNAIKLLRWKQDNDPAFVNLLQKKRGAARHTLESLMLLPVHRVWEYDRLLTQLLLLTPNSHPDYYDLQFTVENVHKMVQSREAYLNYSENVSKISQVQARFPNDFLHLTEPLEVSQAYAVKGHHRKNSSVSPASSRSQTGAKYLCQDVPDGMIVKTKSIRFYIQEGPVNIISGLHQQERFMFLFSDLLLIAKPAGRHTRQQKMFRLKDRVRVAEMWVADCIGEVTDASSVTVENAFVFGWPNCIGYNVVAAFSSAEERELWKGFFTKHIDTQQQLIEPKSLYINAANETDSASVGPLEILEVDYNETVKEVLGKALEIFRISESVDHVQMLVKLSREEPACPLLGHEFPYAIQLSSIRSSDQGMETQLHFVIRKRQRLVETSSAESTPQHQASSSSRRPGFRRTFRNANPLQLLPQWRKRGGRTKPLKFFGTPLSLIMPEGKIPLVLQDMLIRIFVEGPTTHGIFRRSANAQRARELKASIDAGQRLEMESVSTHVVAALFKEFLRNIPGGLLPSSDYTILVATNDCKIVDERALMIRRIVDKFPEENQTLVQYVIPLLHHISLYHSINSMPTTNIAICLAPTLLYTDVDVIMNEVPPLVQFLIEHSPKIFGSEMPELFESLPLPQSDLSLSDNTPPVTLVLTKVTDGGKPKRLPISLSSEDSLQSQGDTSLSDDSLGEGQVQSDSALYDESVVSSGAVKKHLPTARGGRGSVLLNGQSIASLHQDTDDEEDVRLPTAVTVPDDRVSTEDPADVTSRMAWHYRDRNSRRHRHRSTDESSRRRTHLGISDPLVASQSGSSSPNVSPKIVHNKLQVEDIVNPPPPLVMAQPDVVTRSDEVQLRRRRRGNNNARPVGIIGGSLVNNNGAVVGTATATAAIVGEQRYRNIPQYPSTYSVDSLKSSSSEERTRSSCTASVADSTTSGGSPGMERSSFRKRLELNDRVSSVGFAFPRRRSFRTSKEKRTRKAARSQSMKETNRQPESVIVNVHYHTTSSSYDDLTMFKKKANNFASSAVQHGDEKAIGDLPEHDQHSRPPKITATSQTKDTNRTHPLQVQNASPRSSRFQPDSEESKMVKILKQKAMAKLVRGSSIQHSPTETSKTPLYHKQSLSIVSPRLEGDQSMPTHRLPALKSYPHSSSDKIEPCRITRRNPGSRSSVTQQTFKRKSITEATPQEREEMHKAWKAQAPTIAEKKQVWEVKSQNDRSRTNSEGGSGTLKAEMEAARQKLQATKLPEPTKPTELSKPPETSPVEQKKTYTHQVSKFVNTAKPKMAVRQVVVKVYSAPAKFKPRKIIFYPPKRIVEL